MAPTFTTTSLALSETDRDRAHTLDALSSLIARENANLRGEVFPKWMKSLTNSFSN